jgi:hypothetical protein
LFSTSKIPYELFIDIKQEVKERYIFLNKIYRSDDEIGKIPYESRRQPYDELYSHVRSRQYKSPSFKNLYKAIVMEKALQNLTQARAEIAEGLASLTEGQALFAEDTSPDYKDFQIPAFQTGTQPKGLNLHEQIQQKVYATVHK